jgi:FRG domain
MSGFELLTGQSNDNKFSADEFLNLLRRSRDHWFEDIVVGQDCPWVFRGQPDASWELIPSAARDLTLNQLTPLIDRVRSWPVPLNHAHIPAPTGHAEMGMLLGWAAIEALNDFARLAYSLKLSPDARHSIGKESFSTTTTISAPGQTIDQPLTMLAQHHRVPTLLLDWTRRPDVAAHFATNSETLPPGSKDISVYALRIDENDYSQPATLELENTRPYRAIRGAPMVNAYLGAQDGLFTYHADRGEYAAEGKYPSLEERILEVGFAKVRLRKFVLRSSEVPRLRTLLDREGLTDAHLMPTLDNVSSTIMKRWRSQK